MATELKISTGIEEFTLNEAVTVRFNPSDPSFIEKVFNTFELLDQKQEEYGKKMSSAEAKDVLKLMKEYDGEMRVSLAELFGVDVVTPMIGDMNVHALSDGAPIWMNILLAVIDTMEENTRKQHKLSTARMAKYTAKYEAADHKKKGAK